MRERGIRKGEIQSRDINEEGTHEKGRKIPKYGEGTNMESRKI